MFEEELAKRGPSTYRMEEKALLGGINLVRCRTISGGPPGHRLVVTVMEDWLEPPRAGLHRATVSALWLAPRASQTGSQRHRRLMHTRRTLPSALYCPTPIGPGGKPRLNLDRLNAN